MDIWITLALILLILTLIAFIPVSLVFISKESFTAKLRISFITVTLYDGRKKKRPKRRKYTKKALKKQRESVISVLSKKHGLSSEDKKASFKETAQGTLSLLSSLFEDLIFPVVKKARVKFKYFKITVASKDPADTAILYGVLCQGVSYLLNSIANNAKISDRQLKKVKLECNFLSEKTTLEIHTIVRFNLWQLIFAIARGSSDFFEKRNNTENITHTNDLTVTN